MATIKKEYSVLGMSCGKCQAHVQAALDKEIGVVAASVDLASKVAHIEYDPDKTSPEKIKKAVDEAGYHFILEE